jgi:hypothetical protein
VQIVWLVNPLLVAVLGLAIVVAPFGYLLQSLDKGDIGGVLIALAMIVGLRVAIRDRRGPPLPRYWLLLGLHRILLVALIVGALCVNAVDQGFIKSVTMEQLGWGLAVGHSVLLLAVARPALRLTRQWFFRVPVTPRVINREFAVRCRATVMASVAVLVPYIVLVRTVPGFPVHFFGHTVGRPALAISYPMPLLIALTAVAAGYVVLAVKLWRAARARRVDVHAAFNAQSEVFAQLPLRGHWPSRASTEPTPEEPRLPRDPKTGRVRRQFDV